jgi:hypothetical protein
MSSASWVVRVAVLGDTSPGTIYSTGIVVVGGDLSTRPGSELEELSSPGVNLQRHRERRRVFKDLVLQLIEDFADPTLLLQREADYQVAEGLLCRLTARLGTAAKTWDRSTIKQVRIVARHGKLVGFGAATNSLHTLISEWTFKHNRDGSEGP